MKQQIVSIFEKLLDLLPVILLGGFGGFIRTVAGKVRGEPYRWRMAIPEILIAIFAGLVVYWLMVEYKFGGDNLRAAATSLAGYCARPLLAICREGMPKIFKMLLKRKSE